MFEITDGFGKSIKKQKCILISEEEYDLLKKQVVELKLEVGVKQAKIDQLMLEYCPDEMTEAQKEEWSKHQVPVNDKEIIDMCSTRG